MSGLDMSGLDDCQELISREALRNLHIS